MTRVFKKLRNVVEKYKRNKFINSVGWLVGGTALGQAITIIVLPLLTRIYTPADFATMAVFVSILTVVSSIACLRFEIAIPLPERETEAVNLFVLAIISSIVVSGVTLTIFWTLSSTLTTVLGQPFFESYFWLIPLGTLSAGFYTSIQFWSTRNKDFNLIAKTKLIQAGSSSVAQLGLGLAGIAPLGLLVGHVLSSGSGMLSLLRKSYTQLTGLVVGVNAGSLRRTLRHYWRFPTLSTVESLANSGAAQVPILIIAIVAAGPEVGFLMLATRIMAAPVSLIGGAVSQVYLANAASELRENRLDLFTTKVLRGLFRTGVGPLVFVGVIAPVLFPIVFGSEWDRAGEIVQWMTPWFVFQFLSSPVSMALHVTGNQKTALTLQIGGLIARAGAVTVAAIWLDNHIIEIYAFCGFLFYLTYFLVVLNVVGASLGKVLKAFLSESIYVFMWLAVSLVSVNVIRLL